MRAFHLFGLYIVFLMLSLSFGSCSKANEDDSPVTILVTQGMGEDYMRSLAKDVKKSLDIDVEFVYEVSTNISSLILLDFMNNNLKADMIFTGAKIRNEYLENSCLDFIAYTPLTSNYPYERLQDCMADNGAVYELPLSAKLIGITYNATLMEEKGWELPKNFDDMVALKRKCDAARIPFAITDVSMSGCGFNYLFHIMGSQWLSTVKGDVWIEGFLDGTKTVNVFKDRARYFEKWVDNGLFGELCSNPAGATAEFSRRRALFCYAVQNHSSGYEGPQYDANGNETGVMLNDIHKTMPWISEHGMNNCFTIYYNCWVMLNRSLIDPDKKAHLNKVLEVMAYMMSSKYSKKATELSKDTYLSAEGFQIGRDRLYSEYARQIKSGFLQPWYYNYFNEGTIISTGVEINSYMINQQPKQKQEELTHVANYDINPRATYNSAIATLRNSLHAQDEDYLGYAEELLDAESTAQLAAIAGGMALQEKIGDGKEIVRVAMLPYAKSIADLQPWRAVAVENTQVYPGVLKKAYSYVMQPAHCQEVLGIWMTGEEINNIIENKYDPSCYFIDKTTGISTFDNKKYGPYPYVCVRKNHKMLNLKDKKEYLVAVPRMALEKDVFEKFEKKGKILLSKKNKQPITANTAHGIQLFFSKHQDVSRSNIIW